MKMKISVNKNHDADIKNADNFYIVKIGDSAQVSVHTNILGEGLWVNGVQVEGTAEFNIGLRPASRIRRYFERNYEAYQ